MFLTFKELRELLFWTVDSGKNVEETAFLHDGSDGRLINAALRDLADCLHIVKMSSTLVPDASGVVALPDDFRDPLLVRWGDYTRLVPIDSILMAAIGSKAVVQYMMISRASMQLYDVPEAPLHTLHLWYHAYPAPLVNDNDVPVDVPPEHHEILATIYAKAQLVRKFGDFQQYRQLMGWWAVFKKEIVGITAARVNPEMFTREWKW